MTLPKSETKAKGKKQIWNICCILKITYFKVLFKAAANVINPLS